MSGAKRIAFLRHGLTAWNLAGRIQGRTDIPLAPEGRERLAGLTLPPDWSAATVHASPLSRAMETARLWSETVRSDARLIEMDWGKWEGCRGADLRGDPASGYRDIEEWGWDFRPPGGESPADLRRRLEGWLDDLRHDPADRHLAVTHVGTIRVALALAWDWPFRGLAPFRVKRDRLYVVTLEPDGRLRPASEPDGVRLPCRPPRDA